MTKDQLQRQVHILSDALLRERQRTQALKDHINAHEMKMSALNRQKAEIKALIDGIRKYCCKGRCK